MVLVIEMSVLMYILDLVLFPCTWLGVSLTCKESSLDSRRVDLNISTALRPTVLQQREKEEIKSGFQNI